MSTCFLCDAPCENKCPVEGCETYYCSLEHLRHHQIILEDGRTLCMPFKIDHSPTKGRHFVATRNIRPLELVVHEDPAVVGPATKTKPLCLNCLQPATGEDRCSGCNFPCCGKCSGALSERSLHSEEECRILRDLGYGTSITDFEKNTSLVYACIWIYRAFRWKENNPEYFNYISRYLMAGDTSDLESYDFVDDVFDICQSMASGITKEDVVAIMGVKRTNANDLALIGLNSGVALYSTYPLMNSHCFCNTRCIIDPKTFKIEVRASKAIKKGEEITTRYFNPWQGQPFRRQHILTHWGFVCNCHRCQSPSDLDTNFSSIKCKECDEGYLLPSSNLDQEASHWLCAKCGTRLESNDVESILEGKKAMADMAEKDHGTIPDVIAELGATLHPNHYIIFDLKETYVSSSQVSKDQIDVMSIKIQYTQDVLQIVQVLDPGYTVRTAALMKTLATTRMDLSKLKMQRNQQTKEEHLKEVKSAIGALKIVQAMTFQCPEMISKVSK